MSHRALPVALLLAVGCLKAPTPAQQAQDGKALYDCVQQHWGETVAQVAGDCANQEVAVAEDVIADIEALSAGSALIGGKDPYLADARIAAKTKARLAARAPAK